MKKLKNPIKYIVASFGLASIALITMGIGLFFLFNENSRRENHHSNIINLAGEVKYLQEVLAMSIKMAYYTKDKKWVHRYNNHKSILQHRYKKLVELKLNTKDDTTKKAYFQPLVQLIKEQDNIINSLGEQHTADPFNQDEYLNANNQFHAKVFYFTSPIEEAVLLKQLKNTIIHLDEILTMSTRLNVESRNDIWRQRYNQYEPILDLAIKNSISHAPDVLSGNNAKATDDANIKLINMEIEAFKLVENKNYEKARSILNSKEYAKQKKIYSEGMNQFSIKLDQVSDLIKFKKQNIKYLSLTFIVFTIIVLLFSFIVSLKVIRDWKRAMNDMTKKLKDSQENLQKQVTERTSSLFKVNKNLKKEIEQNKQLLDIINTTPDIIEIYNPGKKTIDYINDAGKQILEANSNLGIAKIKIENLRPKHAIEQINNIVLKELKEYGLWQGESHFFNHQGEVIPTLMVAVSQEYNNKEYIYFISKDMSKMQELQNQLIQSQKMETVGQLAGGIAHDFNNIMMIINGNCNLLLQQNLDQILKEDITEIHKAGKRAASLTKQLLTFSRNDHNEVIEADLNHLLCNMKGMLERLLSKQFELIIDCNSSLKPVLIDPVKIEQVLVNLAVNAKDAMTGKGSKLIFKTYYSFPTSHTIKNNCRNGKKQTYICLECIDDGIGMDEKTMGKIFEPFFTTKGPDKGTGLGLSTIYGIMQRCNGFIDIISKPNEGTTFKLFFPVHQNRAKKTEEPALVVDSKL